MKSIKKLNKYLYFLSILVLAPSTSYAMHINEGYLTPTWSGLYFLLILPFMYLGIKDIKKKSVLSKNMKLFIGLVGACCFILSTIHIPSVVGSSSHPTGVGFGTILFGPFIMSVMSLIILSIQSLFLSHGGITTLGANTFSMGVVGTIVAYFVYKLVGKNKVGIFLATATANIAVYLTTSIQLALSNTPQTAEVGETFLRFVYTFAITQIPIAIIEGVLTVLIFNVIRKYYKNEVDVLSIEEACQK